jgi:hypothetical protein
LAKAQFQAAAAEQVKSLYADAATRPIAEAVVRLAKELQDDPYRGEPLREKANLKPLAEADCRKVKFDLPDRKATAKPRYRFRLVYRIEPHEGSPEELMVLAVGVKPGVYRDATREAAARLKELAKLRRN